MSGLLHTVTEGPTLWYLNRGTGLVLLGLLTVTTLLGILATRGRAGRLVPAFVSQSLHRNLALLSVTLLVAHIVTAVVDTFVDIRWWQALVPWVGATYLPLWLGLGTLAFDVLVVVVVTSLARARMSHRAWRVLHLGAYAAWGLAVAHGFGIGTDLTPEHAGGRLYLLGCVAVVALAVVWRLVRLVPGRADRAGSALVGEAR